MVRRERERKLKNYPPALNVNEVAEILRMCTKTVYKMIRQKVIPAVKVGREYRISKQILISYLQQCDKCQK